MIRKMEYYRFCRYSPGVIILNGNRVFLIFSVVKSFLSKVMRKSAFWLFAPAKIGASFFVMIEPYVS